MAVFSSSTVAVGETGCVQIVFEGEGPKARGPVLLPPAPLPREYRVAGRGVLGTETILEQAGRGRALACARPGKQAPRSVPCPGGGLGRSLPSPPSPVSGRPPCPRHPLLVFFPPCGRPEGHVCKSLVAEQNTPKLVCSPNWNPP